MRFALSLAALFWATAAAAQQPNCTNPLTQTEMNICTAQSYDIADARLNALWKIVKPQFDAIGHGAALLDSQRKWLAYRDAACAVEAALYQGGTIAPLVHATCLAIVTDRRADDLNALRN